MTSMNGGNIKTRKSVSDDVVLITNMAYVSGKLRDKIQVTNLPQWVTVSLRVQGASEWFVVSVYAEMASLKEVAEIFDSQVHR